MQYPEEFIKPFREELTRLGVEELRTSEAVDAAVQNSTGTLMIVVNSICGCAAGKARAGVAQALKHGVRPDRVATVFAGGDCANGGKEAVDAAQMGKLAAQGIHFGFRTEMGDHRVPKTDRV